MISTESITELAVSIAKFQGLIEKARIAGVITQDDAPRYRAMLIRICGGLEHD